MPLVGSERGPFAEGMGRGSTRDEVWIGRQYRRTGPKSPALGRRVRLRSTRAVSPEEVGRCGEIRMPSFAAVRSDRRGRAPPHRVACGTLPSVVGSPWPSLASRGWRVALRPVAARPSRRLSGQDRSRTGDGVVKPPQSRSRRHHRPLERSGAVLAATPGHHRRAVRMAPLGRPKAACTRTSPDELYPTSATPRLRRPPTRPGRLGCDPHVVRDDDGPAFIDADPVDLDRAPGPEAREPRRDWGGLGRRCPDPSSAVDMPEPTTYPRPPCAEDRRSDMDVGGTM